MPRRGSRNVSLGTGTPVVATWLDFDMRIDPLEERYVEVRARTERLAAPLSAEDQLVQSMPDTSPTKWHRAHTTWFFAEFVLGADGTSGRVWDRPEYRFLFNSYYDAVGARHPRPDRGLVTRPSLAEVAAYRADVDKAMLDVLDDARRRCARCRRTRHPPRGATSGTASPRHQARPLDEPRRRPGIRRQRWSRRAPTPARSAGSTSPVAWSRSGERQRDGCEFMFDNEGPAHEVRVYDVALADRLVTAGEWLDFIDDGGYRRPELWKSDGWYRALEEGWSAPLYWRRDPDDPSTGRSTPSPVPGRSIPTNRWSTCRTSRPMPTRHGQRARLPTEFEWEHAARDVPVRGVFLDDQDRRSTYHPTAAGPCTGCGLRQLFGDCWEWTSSAYQPYPGFRPADGAIGEYNGKFMSGQQVLRGGGALTPPGHVRATYRNFFHPHTRWHLAGVRLARDAEAHR